MSAAAAPEGSAQSDPVWMSRPDRRSLAEIHAVSGPNAGRVWPLGIGVHDIGSAPGNAIVVADAGVPEQAVLVTVGPDGRAWLMLPAAWGGQYVTEPGRIAWVNVTEHPEPEAGGGQATREIPWPTGDDLVLGQVVLRLTTPHRAEPAATASQDSRVTDYSRPPRTACPPVPGSKLRMPDPPAMPPRSLLPVVTIAVILLLLGLAWLLNSFFLSASALFASAFAAMNWFFQRCRAHRAFRRNLKDFRDRRMAAYATLRETVTFERAVGCDTMMDPAQAALTAMGPGPRLWERRRRDPDYLMLRVGTVDQPSVTEVEDPAAQEAEHAVRWNLHDAPLGLDLATHGVVGLAGEAAVTRAVAAWMIIQAAVLHSPRDLRILPITSGQDQARWEWVWWLPHAWAAEESVGKHSAPPRDDLIPRGTGQAAELVSAVRARGSSAASGLRHEPDIIAVVDGTQPWRELAELARTVADGPARRLFSICLDEREASLPRACTAVVQCRRDALAVRRPGRPAVAGIRPDLVSSAWCSRVARSLTAVRDVSPD